MKLIAGIVSHVKLGCEMNVYKLTLHSKFTYLLIQVHRN